jgi:hypothetical protein
MNMAKYKTEFDLNAGYSDKSFIEIWPVDRNNSKVILRIVVNNQSAHMKGNDLKALATNILRALKSKKLKT